MNLVDLNYKNRIVAFIDLLGFQEKVYESTNDYKTFDDIKKVLIHLYEEHKNNEKNKEQENDNFEISVFSDSIVYSSTIEHDFDIHYTIIMIEYLLMELIGLGFLARGGISIGPMIHSNGIIFGPAYIDAYMIEENTAIYPRVVFDDNTFKKIKENLQKNNPISYLEDLKSFSQIICNYKNEIGEKFYFLDYLSQNEYEYIEEYYALLSNAKKIAETGLEKYAKNKRVYDKYVWFQQYIQNVCKKKNIAYSEL